MSREKKKPKQTKAKLQKYHVCLMGGPPRYDSLGVDVEATDYPSAVKLAMQKKPGCVPHPRADQNEGLDFDYTLDQMLGAVYDMKKKK